MEISLAPLGPLLYTLPAAFIIYFSRELIRNKLFSVLGVDELKSPFYYMDAFGMLVAAYTGAGWGGLIQKERRDNAGTFFVSQLWYVVLFFLAYLYYSMNQNTASAYTKNFLISIMKLCEILFYINWIPFPGLDASFFYTQNKMGFKLAWVGKIALVFLLLQSIIPINPALYAVLTEKLT
ncbi:MAG: hypothetical protein D6767_02185 [Candidatus Hydrogenedentota bacterium]|nr:MAG: hypothetical protein D6767_02185 [Candidatus Hydrogenedentota bacterium]